MSKIKEWCQSLVDSGLTSQMPANIDAAIYEQYAKYLEEENNTLKTRLENSVEFPVKLDGLCFSPSIKVVPRVDKEGFVVQPVLYLFFKCDNQKQVDEIMDILEGKGNNDD